jgi:hypothetical protein
MTVALLATVFVAVLVDPRIGVLAAAVVAAAVALANL